MWQRTCCQAVTSWQLHHPAQLLPWKDILPSCFSKKSLSSIQCHGFVWWQTFLCKPVPHLCLSFLNSQIFTKELCGCWVFAGEMGPTSSTYDPGFQIKRTLWLIVISASPGKLLNFTEMVQNVLSESYLGSFLRKRFSPSSELQLSFRISAFLSVRRCLSQASYTAAEAYLGQGLNLADATQPALQTPSFFVPFLFILPFNRKIWQRCIQI